MGQSSTTIYSNTNTLGSLFGQPEVYDTPVILLISCKLGFTVN